ncbi:hypothetical protein HDU81_001101 [Chytriomyces hyalinus]|nr:hypothetical protein HDU81_001101 [Chytriomyces hyalinus]
MDANTILTTENISRIKSEFDALMDATSAWPVVTNKGNVTVRKSKDGHWVGQGPIPLNVARTIQLLTDPSQRLLWDKVMDVYKYVEKVESVDHSKILGPDEAESGTVSAGITYTRLTPAVGGMISARDFLDASVVVQRPGSESKIHDLVWESLDPDTYGAYISSFSAPSGTKSTGAAVRGRNHLAGCRVTKMDTNEDECWMQYCIKSDIKGSVPVWLVDLMQGAPVWNLHAHKWTRPHHSLATALSLFVGFALTLQHWIVNDHAEPQPTSLASRMLFGAAWASNLTAIALHALRVRLYVVLFRKPKHRSNPAALNMANIASRATADSPSSSLPRRLRYVKNVSRIGTSMSLSQRDAQFAWRVCFCILATTFVAALSFLVLSLLGIIVTAKQHNIPFKSFGEGLARACLATGFGVIALILMMLDTASLLRAFKLVYPRLYAKNRSRDLATGTTNPDLEISSEGTHAPISTHQSFRGPPVDLLLPEDQRLAVLFCALVVLINVTCIIFMQFEKGWDFWAAEQWYISSITTLGFGQVHVLAPASKYSLLFFNTVGIILLALILAALSSKLISLIRKFLLRGIRKVRQKADMRLNRVEARRKRQRQQEHGSTTGASLTLAPESPQRHVCHTGRSTNHNHTNDHSDKTIQETPNSPAAAESTSASDSQIALSRTSTVDSTTEAANELGYAIDDLPESDDQNDDETENERPQLPTPLKRRLTNLKKKKTAQTRKNAGVAFGRHGAENVQLDTRDVSAQDENLGNEFLISKKESPQSQNSVWRFQGQAGTRTECQHCKRCELKPERGEHGKEEVDDVGTTEQDTDAAYISEDDGAHTLESPCQGSLSLREDKSMASRKKRFSVSKWLRQTHEWLETHADTVAFVILIPLLLFGGAALFMAAEYPEWDYIESLYFNYSLITTTGYGDIYPKTGWGRTLVIIMVFNGLGVWAYAVSTLALSLQHWALGDYDSLDDATQQPSQTWVPRLVFGSAWACAGVALAAHITRGCLSRPSRPLAGNRSSLRLASKNLQMDSAKADSISPPVHSSRVQLHALTEDVSLHIPSNLDQSKRDSIVHARKNAQHGWMVAFVVLIVSAVATVAFVALSLAGIVLTAQHYQLPFKAFGEGLTRACLATAFGLVALLLLVFDLFLYIGAFKTARHTTNDSSTTHTHLKAAPHNILQTQPPADLMLAEDVVLTGLFCTLIILINVASFIFMNLEDGWSFRSAEQWYISSVTTLGFGQVHVLKPASKYALLFSSTLGIILLASILATIASKLISIIRKFLLRGIRKVRQKAAARKKRFAQRKLRRAEEQARLREQECLKRFNELEALVNRPDSTSPDGAESQWAHGATWHGTSENGKFLAQFGKQLAAQRRALAESKTSSIIIDATPSRVGSPTDLKRTYSSSVVETLVLVEPSSSPHPPPRSIPRSLSVTAFALPSSKSSNGAKLSNAFPLTSSASTSRMKYPNPVPGAHDLQAASYESLSNLNTDFGVPLTRITTMDSTTEAAHELGYTIDDSDQNYQDDDMHYNFGKLQKSQNAPRRRLDRKKVHQMTREFQIRKRRSGAAALAFDKHWKRGDNVSDNHVNSSNLNPNKESQQTMRPSRRRKPRSSIQHMMHHEQNSVESGTENEQGFPETPADVENYMASTTEDEEEETPDHQSCQNHRSSFVSANSAARRRSKKKFSVSRQLLRIHSWLESQADAVALAILIPLVLFGGALLFMLAESPDWDYVESLYFNYSLITTTGYGDIYPKSGWGRTLVIVMVFLGLGLWAYAVSSVGKW